VAAAVERYGVEGMTERQALRAAVNPRLAAAFRGERIDTFAKEAAGARRIAQRNHTEPYTRRIRSRASWLGRSPSSRVG